MVACLFLFPRGSTAQSTTQYQFLPAGNFSGATYTVPLAASVNQIVGDYWVPGGVHAYVQTGKTLLKAEPLGSLDAYLSGINGKGVAAGGYCPKGCNPETGQHGYTYDSNTGKIRTINFPMQGAATTAFGINDYGVVVGGYCPSNNVCPSGAANPTDDGFVDDHGVFTTLNFPDAQATSAFAINNAGTIVGFYLINNTGPHAFLYENGNFTNIDFPGSDYSIATAINTLGTVAGLFADSAGLHGFTYNNGTFAQIDKPGATGTGVTGINDRDVLVGLWYPTKGEENFRAVPVAPEIVPGLPDQ